MPKQHITVRLEEEHVRFIEAYAKLKDMKRSDVIREALDKFISAAKNEL